MHEAPLGPLVPWRIRADDLRNQLQSIPRFEDGICSLSKWFEVLRVPPYKEENADERLRAAFTSETDNPVAWSAAVSADLPPELEKSLSGSLGPDAKVETLDPLTRYILGRACMKSMLTRPSDTAGLSLAYGLLWPIAHDGIAYAGADDELVGQLDVAKMVRVEIEAEAVRLGEDPSSAAPRFDRDRTVQAIQQASSPVSLEACSHWQIHGLHADLEFTRIIQVVAKADFAFAAKILGMIGNAALVASIIRGSDILDITVTANLLRSVDPVFDINDRWTGKTAGWMILLDIEERLLAPLQKQSGEVRLGAVRPSDPQAIIRQDVGVSVAALLSRPDGPRLALEWFAHLLWSVLQLRPKLPTAGVDGSIEFEPRPLLLQEVKALLSRQDWARPLQIWALFGGSP